VATDSATARTATASGTGVAPGWSSPERIEHLPIVGLQLTEEDYPLEGRHRAQTRTEIEAQLAELEARPNYFLARELRKTRPDLYPNPDGPEVG
jgi:hypothetical protein